ncbi:cation transporter [Crocinitomicaceae bacterium]|jgi:copper chaperone CopZ|nr:cation transporter [Crocinitomicaceae bacterium]
MKHIFILFSFFFLMSCACTQNGEGAKQKETFTVYGNCGMCKKTIETSLEDVSGIYWSDWEIETKQMTVKYNPDLISIDEIQKRIASVGYDSDSHRAKDEVYDKLHGCCKYERP